VLNRSERVAFGLHVFKVVSGLAYVDVVQVVSGCLVRVVYVWLAHLQSKYKA